jgi:hypothetical protein
MCAKTFTLREFAEAQDLYKQARKLFNDDLKKEGIIGDVIKIEYESIVIDEEPFIVVRAIILDNKNRQVITRKYKVEDQE